MQKIALIVGASSGVGAAAAIELAGRGWMVVLSARDQSRLQSVSATIGEASSYFACDASSSDGIDALEAFVRRIEDTRPAEASLMISAPYLAAFNASRMFMRDMLKRRSGTLIHINSPACFMPWPSAVGYSGARFALRGLHEALRQDLAGTGVNSCHIVFGKIDSEYFVHNPGVEGRMPRIASTIPTLTTTKCARLIADVAESPRRQVIHPFMLRLYYWSHLVTPWLTSFLLRATGAKR
jgi:NADP-dependent 3-hydroxy acid dehydrogenase YdfG